MGYPNQFPPSAEEQTCTKLAPYFGEQAFLRALNFRLNNVIEQAADAVGAEFVSVADDFEHHEVCGALGEWMNPIGFTKKGIRDDESFHPKLEGQLYGYAVAVNGAL